MTFDFDTLFTEYLATCDDWGLPRTMQGFVNATYGSIDDRLDDGLEPEQSHLFIANYVAQALESDPDFIINYAS
jgi:hypothetical protein